MNCKPEMKCKIAGDCGIPLKKGEPKSNQQQTFAEIARTVTAFSGTESAELFAKLNEECGQCVSLNEADCTGIAHFYVQGKIAPDFSGAPDVVYVGPEMVEIECKYVMPNPGWV